MDAVSVLSLLVTSMKEKHQPRPDARKRAKKSRSAPSAPNAERPEFVMERFGSIDEMDRSFDIEYWQRQGDAAIFRAAWELVEAYCATRAGIRMSSDFKDLLKRFNADKIRYLIVGGHSVMKSTEPRYTKDLDIWIEASPKNSRAVFRALRAFGPP